MNRRSLVTSIAVLSAILGASASASAQTIILGGSARTYISQGLTTLGEPFTEVTDQWVTPESADILIMSNDGGITTELDYNTHLANGKHVLMIGGSNYAGFYTWAAGYLNLSTQMGWHQSSDCVSDWTTSTPHVMTQYMPATYEFTNPSSSYHMLELAATQPPGTELLGDTCHNAPDSAVLAKRIYPSGGTFTYMAFDIGNYTGGDSQTAFVEPFLTGYLESVRVICGDGAVAGSEQCDDGNTIDNDDCTNACTIAACGDGVVWDQGQGGEACDDGNVVDNDDCTNVCTVATCGDGIVWDLENGAETCDDGNAIDNDDCTNACLDAVCGDSVVWDLGNGTEECDDGNLVDDDMCTNTCIRNAYCGDGATDPGEECDDGAGNSYDPGACRPNCVAPFCGDAISDPNEECDQGINNNNSPDACRPDCAAPACGDGVIDVAGGEECDDGAANGAGGACEATCLLAPESGGGCCSTHDAPAPGLEFLWFGLLLFFVVRRRRVDA